MLPTAHQIFYAVVFPLLLSFAAWLGWIFLTPLRPRTGSLLAATALLACHALAFLSKDPLGPFPPTSPFAWLFFSLPLLFVVAAVESWQGHRKWLCWTLWFLAVVAPLLLVTLWRAFPPISDPADAEEVAKHHFLIQQTVWTILAGLVLAFLLRLSSGHMSKALPATTSWLLALTTGLAAPVVIFAGSTPFNSTFRISSLGFALAPATFLFLSRKLSATRAFPTAFLTPWASLFTATLAATYLYYEGFLWYAPFTLLAAPTLPALVPARYVGWKPTVGRFALLLIPLLTLFVITLVKFKKDAEQY